MQTPPKKGDLPHTPSLTSRHGKHNRKASLRLRLKRFALAKAEGEAERANAEAAAARGSNAALANVPRPLINIATTAADKADADYSQAQSVSQRLQAMMTATKQGNVVSYQLLPEEGALQVTTSQGVHRINMAEIQNYGGGSLWQKLQGHIGKALTGESIPSSVLDDMADMQKIQAEGSQKKYENAKSRSTSATGANFELVDSDGSDGSKCGNCSRRPQRASLRPRRKGQHTLVSAHWTRKSTISMRVEKIWGLLSNGRTTT